MKGFEGVPFPDRDAFVNASPGVVRSDKAGQILHSPEARGQQQRFGASPLNQFRVHRRRTQSRHQCWPAC